VNKYAKAIVAIVGAAVTAALGVFPSGGSVWTVLQLVAAALTAAGVYTVPNASKPAGVAPAAPADPPAAPAAPKPAA
jgi:hypothetical protein